ncbi:MAG: thioredoxin-like domain-containing protein [bacterium]
MGACFRSESPSGAGGSPHVVTGNHRALSLERDWLNVSRSLQPEDLAGRIVLVDFWTYCCINCIHVMPDLKSLEREFGPALTVIGVHSGKFDNERDVENIRAAVLRYGIEHPVVNDADFKIWNAFGVNSWPTLILLNPDGEVESSYSGEGHYQELREEILRLQRKYAGKLRRDALPIALEKSKAPAAVLNFPGKLAFAPDLNRLFVSDSGHHRILGFDPEGRVMTVIGGGGPGWKDGAFAEAQFQRPQGLAYADRKLYVADTENHLLRLVDLESGRVSTLAGTGKQGFERAPQGAPAATTPLSSPWDVEFFPGSQSLVIAMAGTHQLWSYDLATRTLSVLAGNGRESIEDGVYPDNSLSQPSGLSAWERKLYFVDSETSSLRLLSYQPDYKVLLAKLKTLIGTGLFDFGFKDGRQGEARMQHPLGVWAEASGVYIADAYNHAIRRYDPASGRLSTVAGDGKRGAEDGDWTRARFNEPNDLIRVGEKFFVADTNNHAIRILDPATQKVLTLALTLPGEAASPKPAERLPNLKIDETLRLAPNAPIPLNLKFAEGWKLNVDAPSSLRLFQEPAGPAAFVKAYGRAELSAQRVELPALEPGRRYLLQGTFYYCREGKEALCFLQSAQAKIDAAPGGLAEIVWGIGP